MSKDECTQSTQPGRKRPELALRYAVEMLGKGYADVVIVDLANSGKAYSPADFCELYLDGKKNASSPSLSRSWSLKRLNV